MERTPMLNNDEQYLKYPLCGNRYEIEKYKEDNLTSEEDSTEQAREGEKKKKM